MLEWLGNRIALTMAIIAAFGLVAGASAAAPPKAVTISIDWAEPRGIATADSYGLNVYSGVIPSVAQDPDYAQNMAYMGAGLLRYHYGKLVKQSRADTRIWVHPTEQRWDSAKIAAALDAVRSWSSMDGYRPKLLIMIPDWPSWMKTYSKTFPRKDGTIKTVRGYLDPSEYDAFAAFCADLVRILNVEQKRGIEYFEITNERDNLYYAEFARAGIAEQNNLAELTEIYNRAAVAMKAVDPSIKLGGLAFARPDLAPAIQSFVAGAAPNIDFLSIHLYASMDKTQSDAAVYDKTDLYGRTVKAAVAIADAAPGGPIPVHLNEHNISWTFTNNDPRMQNVKGAVFDALTLIRALENGAQATNAWNERDDIYGKMSSAEQLRPAAHVYHLFNRFLQGSRHASASSDPAVVPMAIHARGHRAVALVNRGDTPRAIRLAGSSRRLGRGQRPAMMLHRISERGLTREPVQWKDLQSGRVTLAAHSVNVLVSQNAPL